MPKSKNRKGHKARVQKRANILNNQKAHEKKKKVAALKEWLAKQPNLQPKNSQAENSEEE